MASTLCKYDFRKGDLFVLGWARLRRVRRESISSELIICGGGVHSVLLLHLVAYAYLDTIVVCLLWKIMGFSLGVLKYVGVRHVMDVVFSVCILTCMGSMSVLSYRCYIFVSCVKCASCGNS